MQMLVGAGGFGVGIPKTSLGVGLGSVGKMYFRELMDKGEEKASCVIGDLISIGQKSGTFIVGGVTTRWFDLDPVKDNWIHNLNWLMGKTAEIKISGLQAVTGGTADIEVIVMDKDNRPSELVKRVGIKTDGTQLTEIAVRGVIQKSDVDSKGRKIIY